MAARYEIDLCSEGEFLPYGEETVGIIDNHLGGILLFCHQDSAERVIMSLHARDRLESTLS